MTTLQSFLTPVFGTRPAPALAVTGTALEAELTTFLRAQHVNCHRITAALQWVETHGTAADCPALEEEEQVECDLIVRNRLGDVESDPATWPAAFDSERWVLTDDDDEDFSGLDPAFHTIEEWDAIRAEEAACTPPLPFALDFEPTHAERVYWASEARCNLFDAECDRRADEAFAEALLEARLLCFPAICGGSPTPDEKPIRVQWDDRTGVRSRPVRGYSDSDHRDNGHAV